jgi:hypothetical protein
MRDGLSMFDTYSTYKTFTDNGPRKVFFYLEDRPELRTFIMLIIEF